MAVKYRDFAITTACFAFCLHSTLVFAEQYESVDNIKNVTKTFITNNLILGQNETLDVQINSTDAHFKVPVCTQPIAAAFPKNIAHEQASAIELSCDDNNPWHVFVPVTIQIMTPVITARQSIPAQQLITEDDLEVTPYDKKRIYSAYFKDKSEIIGQVASQTIPMGTVISKRNIAQQTLVHRDQVINLIVKTNAVMVTMTGIAKSDGRLNDAIKAYNPSSKKMMDAVVTGTGKAEIIS